MDAVTHLIRRWLLNLNWQNGACLSNSDNFFFFCKIPFLRVNPFLGGNGTMFTMCATKRSGTSSRNNSTTMRLKKNRNSDRLQSHTSLPVSRKRGSNYATCRRAFGSVWTAAIGVMLMPSRRSLTLRPTTVTACARIFRGQSVKRINSVYAAAAVVYVRGLSACGFHFIIIFFFNYNYFHNPRNETIKTTIIRSSRSKPCLVPCTASSPGVRTVLYTSAIGRVFWLVFCYCIAE